MISLKKQLVKQELDTLFNNYPIVVWYQTKQKSTREWTRLKEKVKALTPSDESTLKTVQTKTAIGILYPKQYYGQKTYLSTKEIYQNINQVAITAGNEQHPTTLKTIEVDEATRYLSS